MIPEHMSKVGIFRPDGGEAPIKIDIQLASS